LVLRLNSTDYCLSKKNPGRGGLFLNVQIKWNQRQESHWAESIEDTAFKEAVGYCEEEMGIDPELLLRDTAVLSQHTS
jgi:hypothetical protein